jgi:hypothetical protein
MNTIKCRLLQEGVKRSPKRMVTLTAVCFLVFLRVRGDLPVTFRSPDRKNVANSYIIRRMRR